MDQQMLTRRSTDIARSGDEAIRFTRFVATRFIPTSEYIYGVRTAHLAGNGRHK
jgi:hypothetical protein